jgi:hypothetical protein
MGGACSAYREGRGINRGLVENLDGKSTLGYPGIDGRIILR